MDNKYNIYQVGATDGLYLGLYFIVMLALQVIGLNNMPMLALIGEVMMIGVPVLAYWLLIRNYKATGRTSHLSAIWMHGIMMFLGGSLLMGLVAYIYLRFLNPMFIADMFETASKLYLSMPDADLQHIGTVLHSMIEKKLLPTPISMSFTLIWFGAFTGAMLSLILAILIRFLTRRANGQPPIKTNV